MSMTYGCAMPKMRTLVTKVIATTDENVVVALKVHDNHVQVIVQSKDYAIT